MAGRARSKHSAGRAVSEMLRSGEPGLGQLLRQARKLEALDCELSALLDASLGDKVQVAALRTGRLVLITSSAALATRLRIDAGQLAQTLRAKGYREIEEVLVRVVPAGPVVRDQRRRRELPAIAKQTLERFAIDSGDEEIKAIVSRKNRRKNDRE